MTLDRVRIFDLFIFLPFALADSLNEVICEPGILKEHRAYKAYSEKVVPSYRILLYRDISYYLQGVENKVFISIRNTCPVYKADVAVAGLLISEDDVAGVTLFELFLE